MTACAICTVRPPRPPMTASRACKPCVDELTRLLEDLETLLPMLRSIVEPGRLNGTGGGRVDASPAPLRVDVLSLLDSRNTDSPGRVLARWAVTFQTGATPHALRQALGRIVERDELEAFTKDLRALTAELKRVCGEPAVRVATCHRERPTRAGLRECGGAIIVPSTDRSVARCTVCGDEWPREHWGILGRLQDA